VVGALTGRFTLERDRKCVLAAMGDKVETPAAIRKLANHDAMVLRCECKLGVRPIAKQRRERPVVFAIIQPESVGDQSRAAQRMCPGERQSGAVFRACTII